MKKIAMLMTILFVLVMTSICFADDNREIISYVEGITVESREDDTPKSLEDVFIYGASMQADESNPFVLTLSGDPAYFYMTKWQKKEGSTWKDARNLQVKTFTAGTYRYWVSIYVDNEYPEWSSSPTAGEDYKITSNTVVVINGEVWQTSGYSSGPSYSRIYAHKEFVMTEPAELQFYDNSSLDIPEGWVNTAIEAKDVSTFVEGGVRPYMFSKVSGPSWINVSGDGLISGTPDQVSNASTLVVRVTDGLSNYKEISISVGKVHKDPASRTQISTVVARSSNIANIPTVGYSTYQAYPNFEIQMGNPAYIYKGVWQEKVGNSYVNKDGVDDIFYAGKQYRFLTMVCIDNKTDDGSPSSTAGEDYVFSENATVALNGLPMTIISRSFNNNSSYITVCSDDYDVGAEIIAPTGSISIANLGTLTENYSSQPFTPVVVTITNEAVVDAHYLKFEFNGGDDKSFSYLLNASTLNGPDTWNNASMFGVRPNTGLTMGSYTTSLALMYDSNKDGYYETCIGEQAISVTITDGRTAISLVEGTMENDISDYPSYGATLRSCIPTITTVVGSPAYFYYNSASWQYKNGDEWESSAFDKFIAGTYRLKINLFIDGDVNSGSPSSTAANDYRLDTNVVVKVNDVTWTRDEHVAVSSNSSHVYVYSPEVVVPEPEELIFPDSDRYNIQPNYNGTPISSIDVSEFTHGGVRPYTYSKVSGPGWISVSSDGVISGTPNVVGENENLVVGVTDKISNHKEITISVAETMRNPDDRIIIDAVNATSNIATMAKPGRIVDAPTFTIADESYPAYFAVEGGNWFRKNGENWISVTERVDSFKEGEYLYKCSVYIDNDTEGGSPSGEAGNDYVLSADVVVTVDGEVWEWEVESVSISEASSNVRVKSKEYTVTSSKPGDVNGDGVINIYDVRMLLQYYINYDGSELTISEKVKMDLNDDDKVDIYDVRILLQMYINA